MAAVRQKRRRDTRLPVPTGNTAPQPWADNSPESRFIMTFAGGLNENTQPDLDECSAGYNFTLGLNQVSLIPRPPFDLRGTTPNASAINGVMQLVTRNGTQTTLIQAGDTVYLWDGASAFTAKDTVNASAFLRSTYWSLGDYLVISDVNLTNVMLTWDGTTSADMVHTGLAGSLYAKFAVVHDNRVWLFNIKVDSTSYPHMILVSEFEGPTSYDIAARGGDPTEGGDTFATGLEAFYLFSRDLKPINGVCFFQNALIISTEIGKLYSLTGTSSKTYKFDEFFGTEPAIGVGQVVSIGNDVLYPRRGGAITRLFATLTYGNVSIANLSKWLPVTTDNLSTINATVYDPNKQRVFIFIPDKVLVLFKDILTADHFSVKRNASMNLSPWSVYITDDDSSFNTNAAAYIFDPGTNNYNVFFGDENGRIFCMDGGGVGDAGDTPIRVLRRSRHIGEVQVSPWPWSQEMITGRIRYRRNTEIDLTITLDWDDEYSSNSSVVTLQGPTPGNAGIYFGGPVYFGGTFYFNQGFNATALVSSINIEPGGKGPGFYLSVSTPTSVPFQVDSVALE